MATKVVVGMSKQTVTGSNPVERTKTGRLTEWFIVSVLKTEVLERVP